MTKAPAIKFPRIEAGFYNVTLDGELIGYIAKKTEGKETSWVVYHTSEADLTIETLPVSAIADETELFREAKEFSKNYFANLPTQEEDDLEPEVQTVELQAPEWTESADELADDTQDFFDEASEFEDFVEEEELVAV